MSLCHHTTERRGCIEHFAAMQQDAVFAAENKPYVKLPRLNLQRKQFWAYLYETCSNETHAATPTNREIKFVEVRISASGGTDA